VEQLELDRHAVVEASAGTGKTYTLEQLVLRLLTDGHATLDQILLVTYTEKATGELKARLRKRLETALSEQPEHEAALRAALDDYDQAPIFTIHGFCQRLLNEFAFENGQEFEPELVQDPSLLPECLREIQRKQWRQQYGPHLRTVLELAGYGDRKQGEKWEDRVLTLAAGFRRSCGDMLLPEPRDDWLELLHSYDQEIGRVLAVLRGLAGPLDAIFVEAHPWATGFLQINYRGDYLASRRRDFLLPLLRWLANPESDRRYLSAFRNLLKGCAHSKTFCRDGFAILTDGLKNAADELPTRCPGLPEAIDAVEALRRRIDWDLVEGQLIVRTVLHLEEHLTACKRERALQSYEDMLVRMDQCLEPACNPAAAQLLETLRDRYHYAIVDEFQDTDPLQWRIFKRIFVDGGERCRLFVVGDPKQAIFRFRGADLPTYLAASHELRTDHGASRVQLDVNWRSSPEMLEALNCLFGGGEWFNGGQGIGYVPVQPPPESRRENLLRCDHSGRAALTVIDLSAAERTREALRRNAAFVAGEIQRLLVGANGEPLFRVKCKDYEGPLKADQICILLFKRTEAGPLVDALRDRQIPYSFYKQTGLWQSEEATHLLYVLRALSRPDSQADFHKALLTNFFRIQPRDLALASDLAENHPARALFQRWVALAETQEWGRLFQSLLDDTGLIYHCDAADVDRRLANCRHIFATLEQAAYTGNLDVLGVLEKLEAKRRHPGEESDYQPRETERPRVQIMTIHSAKGLEFPVVFLAGGFGPGKTDQIPSYRDQGVTVFDLRVDVPQEIKDRASAEQEAEQRRLLYVALTRPMFKLYVPQMAENASYPGPLSRILAPALGLSQVAKLGLPLAQLVDPADDRLEPAARARGEDPGPTEPPVEVTKTAELAGLFPRLAADLSRRRVQVSSFTSLHRKATWRQRESPSFVDKPPRAEDEEIASPEKDDPLRGPVFGEIVHAVLEKGKFEVVAAAQTSAALLEEGSAWRGLIADEVTRQAMKLRAPVAGAALEEICRRQVADLVWSALRTPLAVLGGPLCQIPAGDRLHELEFHLPQVVGDLPPGIAREENFLTGTIDLVFRAGGKFYLLDWKTNWLPAYGPQDLDRSMEECDYVRQYRIYLLALERWLKNRAGPGFDFARDFGGVYYLYLRGMNGRDESSGVYFCRPRADDLRLERVLSPHAPREVGFPHAEREGYLSGPR
jgi:exodeoxyribonuclease V beta subunit